MGLKKCDVGAIEHAAPVVGKHRYNLAEDHTAVLLYRYRFVDSICLFISFVCVLRVDSSLIAHSSRTKLREATPSINKVLATAASSLSW